MRLRLFVWIGLTVIWLIALRASLELLTVPMPPLTDYLDEYRC